MDREALADFLKRRRDALHPEDVGLHPGTRRRTSGLRREEVAALAHMSTDFYARLEQGRGSRPSEQTVTALSRALRLTRDEGDHFFALAGHTPPPRVRRIREASSDLQRVLDKLDTPAQIVSDLYEVLSQNDWAIALTGLQTHFEGPRRSIVYRWFTEPESRQLFHPEDHPLHSRNHVAAMRALYGRSDNDPEAREFVERLLSESPEFASLWERHEVASRSFTVKRFIHPIVGEITLDCQVLTAENLTERLVVLSPLHSEDARRLNRLRQAALAV